MIERLAVAGSGGLVHRGPSGIVLVEASAVESASAEPQLYEQWSAMSPVEQRDHWRAASQAGSLPTMAAITQIDGAWFVMLSGRVGLISRTRLGSLEASPEGAGIHEQRLPDDLVELHVALHADDGVESSLDDAVDLRDGAVIGGRMTVSFALDLRASADASETPADEVVHLAAMSSMDIPRGSEPALANRAGSGAVDLIDETLVTTGGQSNSQIDGQSDGQIDGQSEGQVDGASADEIPDGPLDSAVQVMGIRCPAQHHNHPDASYCSQCGRKLGVNMTTVLVPGARPPLGLLIVDDGTTIPLAADVVVGRDPRGHESVLQGSATPILVPDDSLGLSRAHAVFTLHDWDVAVTDLGSSNGSFLRREDTTEWLPLAPHQRTSLLAGDTIRLAGREMLLELHHVR